MPPTAEAPSRAEGARPRRRLAALSAVGALVLALPLLQVLRFQADELTALRRERAGLSPMAHAVEVQRNLILHRDLSSQVLRGQDLLEPQRAQQQGHVDSAVVVLVGNFAGGLWPRARKESEALRDDWQGLKQQLAERRIAVGESDLAHRLLIEHCLQITDELSDLLAMHGGPATGATAKLVRQMASLPREMWRAAQAVPQTARTQTEAAAELGLQMQRFGALHAAAASTLAERDAVLASQRAALLAAIGALVLLASGLLLHLLRSQRSGGAPPQPPHAVLRERTATPANALAQPVLQRLREANAATEQADPQTTQPPS